MRFFLLIFSLLVGGVVTAKAPQHHNPLFSQNPLSDLLLQDMFGAYIKQYSKKYSSDEFSSRFEIFKKNIEIIRTHNNKENSSYTMGINEFADLSFTEFKKKYFGYKSKKNELMDDYHRIEKNNQVADSVDWRSSNAVTPVKNQGSCGAYYAFSSVGAIEGAWVLQGNHSLLSFSSQQLLDCSFSYGNHGCDGGTIDNAFLFAKQQGLCGDSDYPYTATDGVCQTICEQVVHISGWKNIPQFDENSLYNAVGAIGPVSAGVEADKDGFQFYSSGIFSGDCGTTLNHAVLVVGYGTDNGQDYWIVKNSWGVNWGESGYIRLIRGKNQCGIAEQASYPIL